MRNRQAQGLNRLSVAAIKYLETPGWHADGGGLYLEIDSNGRKRWANPLEIPQALRDLSQQNLKQAHAAYEQLMEFMTKAMGPWMDAVPSNPLSAGLQHMQDRVMEFAMENAEVSVHVRRQDLQRTDRPGYCGASDAVCSRPDGSLRGADAATLQHDRGSFPKVRARHHGHLDGSYALKSDSLKPHDRLQGRTRPCRSHGEGECRSQHQPWSKRSARHRISRMFSDFSPVLL